MPTHYFVGIGPANLDRALKIRKIEPDAILIFFDPRINADGTLDRERSRANIFRFPISDKQTIIDSGIDKGSFEAVSTDRSFSEDKGFQAGDLSVFGSENFTQIQIRDLQKLYLDKLKGPNTHFISSRFPEEHLKLLEDRQHPLRAAIPANLKLTLDESTFHIAPGALTEDTSKHSIIYPAKSDKGYSPEVSPDLQSMPVTAMHGTCTFKLPPEFNIEELNEIVKSLDNTEWRAKLREHGWLVFRPPRVRLFYANDTLYIGTEVPASFEADVINGQPNDRYKQKLAQFTKSIATLMLPGIEAAIGQKLVANSTGVNAPSFFKTHRGESGHVVRGIENTIFNLITHGDRRYLPHYQTGSGFLTATQQNDVYVTIFLSNNFDDLYDKAYDKGYVTKSKADTLTQYKKKVGNDDKRILHAFQTDLYTFATHEILHDNKVKVDKYFTEIQKQTLNLLSEDAAFDELCDVFITSGSKLKGYLAEDYRCLKIARPMMIMEMLNQGNNRFLKYILPQLMNIDPSKIKIREKKDIKRLHHIRDGFTRDYVKYIDTQAMLKTIPEESRTSYLKRVYSQSHVSNKKSRSSSKKTALPISPSRGADKSMLVDSLSKEDPKSHRLFKSYSDGTESFLAFAQAHLLEDDLSVDDVNHIASTIKNNLEAHPELLKTKFGLGFFKAKGKHADLIKQFIVTLNEVEQSGTKDKLLDSLYQFTKALAKGGSIRTTEVMDGIFRSVKERSVDLA